MGIVGESSKGISGLLSVVAQAVEFGAPDPCPHLCDRTGRIGEDPGNPSGRLIAATLGDGDVGQEKIEIVAVTTAANGVVGFF